MGPLRWEEPVRPTISTRRTERRSGWRRATNRPRRFPEGTSFIRGFGMRIRLRWMSSGRTYCSTSAAEFQMQLSPHRSMLANRFAGCAPRATMRQHGIDDRQCVEWLRLLFVGANRSGHATWVARELRSLFDDASQVKSLNSVRAIEHTSSKTGFRFGTLLSIRTLDSHIC
jgi:hypothetical protein